MVKGGPASGPAVGTLPDGVVWLPGFLDRAAQDALVADVRAIVARAPLFRPVTRRGKALSVRMTSAGRVGWISDRQGYRYEPKHPNGTPWPEIPPSLLELWAAVTEVDRRPDSCLVNYYDAGARMGLHQDRDEADPSMPVVSVSLGDDALFRVGGLQRADPTQSFWLRSGDVVVLSGPARLIHHGIDRLRPGTSTLLSGGGRLNLTLRVAL